MHEFIHTYKHTYIQTYTREMLFLSNLHLNKIC